MRLSELETGRKARIVCLELEQTIVKRLMALGVIPGSPIEWIGSGPLKDPQIYRVRGCLFALRFEEAQRIRVEEMREGLCARLR